MERAAPLRAVWQAMDADRDGKLFQSEMKTWLNRRQILVESQTVLGASDSAGDLFEIFDGNRDQRLGAREFAAAAERLADWDRDGDGELSLAETPRHIRLIFGRSDYNVPGLPRFSPAGRAATPGEAKGQGPVWFQEMDRNHDGDLAPNEFLGPLEAFEKLDLDHNGLLDPNEAAAAK